MASMPRRRSSPSMAPRCACRRSSSSSPRTASTRRIVWWSSSAGRASLGEAERSRPPARRTDEGRRPARRGARPRRSGDRAARSAIAAKRPSRSSASGHRRSLPCPLHRDRPPTARRPGGPKVPSSRPPWRPRWLLDRFRVRDGSSDPRSWVCRAPAGSFRLGEISGPGGSRHGSSIARRCSSSRRRCRSSPHRPAPRPKRAPETRISSSSSTPTGRRSRRAAPPSPPPGARSARRTPPSASPRSAPPTPSFLQDVRAQGAVKGAARDQSVATARPGMGHKFADERLDDERAAARPAQRRARREARRPAPTRSPATSGTWR